MRSPRFRPFCENSNLHQQIRNRSLNTKRINKNTTRASPTSGPGLRARPKGDVLVAFLLIFFLFCDIFLICWWILLFSQNCRNLGLRVVCVLFLTDCVLWLFVQTPFLPIACLLAGLFAAASFACTLPCAKNVRGNENVMEMTLRICRLSTRSTLCRVGLRVIYARYIVIRWFACVLACLRTCLLAASFAFSLQQRFLGHARAAAI